MLMKQMRFDAANGLYVFHFEAFGKAGFSHNKEQLMSNMSLPIGSSVAGNATLSPNIASVVDWVQSAWSMRQ
jgi:hypothetical protein